MEYNINKQDPTRGAVDIVHSKRGRGKGDTNIKGASRAHASAKPESMSKVKIMQNHEMSKISPTESNPKRRHSRDRDHHPHIRHHRERYLIRRVNKGVNTHPHMRGHIHIISICLDPYMICSMHE